MKNWFKKIINQLKTEEEAETVEMKKKQSNRIQPMTFNKSKSQARVYYEYPEGKFRFPVIPDLQGVSKEKEQAHPKQPYPKVEKKRHVPQSYRPDSSEQKKPNHEYEKKPFKPTFVPSPIHGFSNDSTDNQSTEEKSDCIVYTSKNAEIKQSEVDDLRLNEAKEEKFYSDYTNQESNEEMISFANEENEENGDNEKSHAIQFEAEVETYQDELKLNPNDSSSSDVLTEDEIVEDDHTDQTENSIPEETVQESHSIESNENSINVGVVSSMKNNDIDADDKEEVHEEEFDRSQKNEPVMKQDEGKIVAHHEDKSGEEAAKDQKNDMTHERDVVPYNVIMLKQDKRNIQNRTKTIPSSKPTLQLLDVPKKTDQDDQKWLDDQTALLNTTLENFNVKAKVVNASKGPSVTRFEVQPEPGVKVNKITNLTDDIKLSMAAKDIRMEAPIPGKNAIGIEVPNQKSEPVFLREIVRHPEFTKSKSPLTVALGLDIAGNPVVTDIKKMPHGLIAGATGSGKSVCINSIIISLLYKADPHQVKLMLIDPKMVELAPYNDIPHLVSPVITDVKAATAALKWAVNEMERRYELFAHTGVRDIERFNQKTEEYQSGEALPYLVIIIDELADLMMMSPQEVEEAICRIAQKARACGIHLLVATQRPSVDVITGLIKANVPTRTAFSVSSQIDSRTIIDINGAEKLLGKGDMLFLENGSSKPTRIQGNFVSDDEIDRITNYVKSKMKPSYLFQQDELIKHSVEANEEDELFDQACDFVFDQDGASASSLQRRFHIGYNRAARLIDMMEAQGIISEAKGSKPRDVLISKEKFENMKEETTRLG